MSSFEQFGCLFAALGAAFGVGVGADRFGFIGGSVGGIVGLCGGWFLGFGVVHVYFAVGINLDRRARRRLRERFCEYYSACKSEAWESLKQQRSVADSVTGTVVTGFYYGVFADIGCGFPCLLTKLQMADAERELQVGDDISAHVYYFDDEEHIVELSQGDVEQTRRFAELLDRSK